jgi:TPP-dependent pyruvate/acetoin dehydrogenase alpha subunit
MKDYTDLLKRLAHYLLVKTATEDKAARKASAECFYEVSNALHEARPIEQPQAQETAQDIEGLAELAAREDLR